MTPDPTRLPEEAHLDEIVKLMEKRQIKRIPVIREERVVGIVTRANLVRAHRHFFSRGAARRFNRRCRVFTGRSWRNLKTSPGCRRVSSIRPWTVSSSYGARSRMNGNAKPSWFSRGSHRRQNPARSPGLGRYLWYAGLPTRGRTSERILIVPLLRNKSASPPGG